MMDEVGILLWFEYMERGLYFDFISRSTPVAQSAPRNLLTRWDVSSIPANGIFLTKNKKKQNINAQRVEND